MSITAATKDGAAVTALCPIDGQGRGYDSGQLTKEVWSLGLEESTPDLVHMSQPMKCVAYPRYTPELPGTHAPRNLVSFIRVCCFHLLSILSQDSKCCI